MEAQSITSVVAALTRMGLLDPGEVVEVHPITLDRAREDQQVLKKYKVHRKGQQGYFVLTGVGLGGLKHCLEQFHAAAPLIVAGIHGWESESNNDWLVHELFVGIDLEAALDSKRIAPDTARSLIGTLRVALASTEQPSTRAAMEAELRALFFKAEEIRVFSTTEQILLMEQVLPWMIKRSREIQPFTRWSNGDFIPRNLQLTSSEQLRLIDYEFAGRTHFFAEDHWRWRTLSSAHTYLGPLPDSPAEPLPAWQEALFILRQITLQSAVKKKRSGSDRYDALGWSLQERLATILAESDVFTAAILLPALGRTCLGHRKYCVAQLFASSSGDYTEGLSEKMVFPAGERVSLRFRLRSSAAFSRLRFDPMDDAGVIEVFSVFLQNETSDLNFYADIANDLVPLNQLVPLSRPGEWLSEGNDPSWELPALANPMRSLHVEVTLHCRPAAPTDPSIKTAIRNQCFVIQRLKTEISATVDLTKHQAAVTEQTIAELGREIEEAKLHLANSSERHEEQTLILERKLSDLTENIAKHDKELREEKRLSCAANAEADKLLARLNLLESQHLAMSTNLRRTHASLSWKITAPLRFVKTLARVRPEVRVNCIFNIDEGLHAEGLCRESNPVRISGWFFDAQGRPASLIQVTVGNNHAPCLAVERPDVREHFAKQDMPLASSKVGFSVELKTGPGLKEIIIEAICANGAIVTLCRRLRWMRRYTKPTGAVHGRSSLPSSLPPPRSLNRLSQPAMERLSSFPRSEWPTISLVMPTYNTPLQFLEQALASVFAQHYPCWELCVADDGSTDSAVRERLKEHAQRDPRIKLVLLPRNVGISHATNAALALAVGPFTALLDHDDELAPDALAEVAYAILSDPSVDAIYTDQDKIDAAGSHFEAFHKPAWSPIYLLGVMYVGHLLVVRTTLLRKIGGCDPQFDRVQDFELMLRVGENAARITHIPKILYHWRTLPGSIAASPGAKGSIESLQANAVQARLDRARLPLRAVPHPRLPHRVQLQPTCPYDQRLVSIIIPTKDAPAHIGRCLESIFRLTEGCRFEVIVADTGTTDPDALAVQRAHPVRRIDCTGPFNFSRVNNLAAQAARGEFLLFLNNDTEVLAPDWLSILLAHQSLPDVGAVGPLLVYPDGLVQHAGVAIGFRGTADHVLRHADPNSDGYAGSLPCAHEVSAVTAACMMMPRALFEDLGGYEESYACHYQDTDLCLRIRERKRSILHVGNVVLRHHESVSRGGSYDLIDRAIFQDRWSRILADGDPFYNPNFSLDLPDYRPR